MHVYFVAHVKLYEYFYIWEGGGRKMAERKTQSVLFILFFVQNLGNKTKLEYTFIRDIHRFNGRSLNLSRIDYAKQDGREHSETPRYYSIRKYNLFLPSTRTYYLLNTVYGRW